jgi:hypothetical protein
MPILPQPRWERVQDDWCWMIDWRALFKGGLKISDPQLGGEMRGFHVVFRLRINQSGRLVFWADDGCVIRRAGELVHCDLAAHALARGELDVRAGDHLEIAQWQYGWGWLWGAQLRPAEPYADPAGVLAPFLGPITERLRHPDGPPLKLYTGGAAPARAVLAVYSLVLNGYAPSELYLFGEHQWPAPARDLFCALLPFAQIVPTSQVMARLSALGRPALVGMAWRYWFVLKLCLSLLHPPEECCVMDDDVFVLDSVADALDAFGHSDLVFAPDQDLGAGYRATWGGLRHLATARFNAGLYWMRPIANPHWLAAQATRARPHPSTGHFWEQGLIATIYARARTVELPSQRYLFPLFQGLPGGIMGYDYARNPCGFASVHFGGLAEKPSDDVALQLAPAILERQLAKA